MPVTCSSATHEFTLMTRSPDARARGENQRPMRATSGPVMMPCGRQIIIATVKTPSTTKRQLSSGWPTAPRVPNRWARKRWRASGRKAAHYLRQQHEHDGADQRTPGSLHAAQQHEQQNVDRQRVVEPLRGHEAELVRIKPPRQSGDRTAQR